MIKFYDTISRSVVTDNGCPTRFLSFEEPSSYCHCGTTPHRTLELSFEKSALLSCQSSPLFITASSSYSSCLASPIFCGSQLKSVVLFTCCSLFSLSDIF